MSFRIRCSLLGMILCLMMALKAAGESLEGPSREAGKIIFESPRIAVDCRRDFGGALMRGRSYISPTAEKQDSQAGVFIGKETAAGWSSESPFWSSENLPDGWYDAVLKEHGEKYTARIAVLNSTEVEIHEGVISDDEIWEAGRLHLIRHWVRIPAGFSLTIKPDAVVKFCRGTGLRVDGTLNAERVMFTASSDDSVYGDTDMDGSSNTPADGAYEIIGNGKLNLKDCRQRYDRQLTWSFNVLPGWNLFALPWGLLDAANEPLLKQWNPMILQKNQWQKLRLPAAAGTVFWIYSSREDIVNFVFSEKILNTGEVQPERLSPFVGIQGTEALNFRAAPGEKVWQWHNNHYELQRPGAGGEFIFQPGIGYVVY